MNGLYTMLLFLFVLGSVTSGVNDLGIFSIKMYDPGLKISQSSVTDLNAGAGSVSPATGSWDIVMMFMKVIGGGILAMFTIVPMFMQWGSMAGVSYTIMVILGTILQGPITFVTLFGLYEWWTGRSLI